METRTSSPVRILRHPDNLEHVQIPGLFPCGEGAGYAGGIVSAGVDGERCAEMCKLMVKIESDQSKSENQDTSFTKILLILLFLAYAYKIVIMDGNAHILLSCS